MGHAAAHRPLGHPESCEAFPTARWSHKDGSTAISCLWVALPRPGPTSHAHFCCLRVLLSDLQVRRQDRDGSQRGPGEIPHPASPGAGAGVPGLCWRPWVRESVPRACCSRSLVKGRCPSTFPIPVPRSSVHRHVTPATYGISDFLIGTLET